ncbi:2-hydroxy-3-oxopropionate reductase [Ruminococcaceae bacterium OttesenSCG-928-D13]|nr:2-hydroxy-3-oxopropionate reductase [Ruminococcaceae bacterium OttesenSCG-928-D13]
MQIGFIGLGIMGKPMAKNLLKAGYALKVYDFVTDAVDEVVQAGAQRAESNADAARGSDVIITMLPNSPHVKAAVLGEAGALEGMAPGTILVDMSSINPVASKEVCAEVEKVGGFMLDAPVSGGEPKAIDGTLAIMVGGKQEVLDKVNDILQVLGASVTLCGDIGSGNTTKLANQIIVASNIAAVGEALTLGKMLGVEPEAIYKAIRSGLAGSTVLDAKAPMMMDGDFKPGFRINLHIKDLANAIDTGYEVGSPLPLTSTVMGMMQWLKANGHEMEDHSALVRYYEYLAKTDVRR